MSSHGLQRLIYKTILSLHPAPFRERFSQEMLWIFNETIPETGMTRMVADALSSLLKQWTATDTVPRSLPSHFQSVPASPLSAANLAGATVIASLVVLGFFTLLQQSVPLPQPPHTFEIRRAPLDLSWEHKTRSATRHMQ